MTKKKPRPLSIKQRREKAHELARLAFLSREIFRESVRIELDTLGDAANLLRATTGTMQAAMGQLQRAADQLERVREQVKTSMSNPHDGLAAELARIAKELFDGFGEDISQLEALIGDDV